MKDALKEVHKKATEIGTVEPKPEFTRMQHSGWTGFRDILITAAEKVIGRGKQPSHAEANSLIVKEQYGFRSKHSVLGPVLVLITLCIEDAVRAKFNPENDPFTCIFADIAKAYPSVPRPELMAVLGKSGIWLKFSNIIRGLTEHARYRLKNSEGHSDGWFNMSLGLQEGCPAAPIEFSIYHSFIMKDLKSRLLENSDESVRVGFSSEEFNDLPLIRENQPAKKVRWARMVESTSNSVNLLLFADDTTSLCKRSNMQHRQELLKQTFGDWKLIIIAENDPEERQRQRKKVDRTARTLGAHRNAMGTFHHDQKHRLMAARKVWFKL